MKYPDQTPVASGNFNLDSPQPIQDIRCLESYNRLRPSPLARTLDSTRTTESIRNAAELVARDYKQVHRTLSELEDVGLNEFEGGGSGRGMKPILAYDCLEVDSPFAGSGDSVGTAAP